MGLLELAGLGCWFEEEPSPFVGRIEGSRLAIGSERSLAISESEGSGPPVDDTDIADGDVLGWMRLAIESVEWVLACVLHFGRGGREERVEAVVDDVISGSLDLSWSVIGGEHEGCSECDNRSSSWSNCADDGSFVGTGESESSGAKTRSGSKKALSSKRPSTEFNERPAKEGKSWIPP